MIKLTRFKNNPILSPNPKNKWESKAVFNPGAIYHEGKIYLLYRAIGEYESYISRFGLAVSDDGFKFKRINKEPTFGPGRKYDRWACEDPRITKVGDTMYITYVAIFQRLKKGGKPTYEAIHSQNSQTALLTTKDFKQFKRHGIITPPDSNNRDVVIFPEKINGKFVIIHRPHRWCKNWFKKPLSKKIKVKMPVAYKDLPQRPATWIATSHDLKNWTNHKILIRSSHEEDEKTGAGPPPIKTKDGWLFIYHHVEKDNKNKNLYTAKVALLSLKNPSKIIAKIPYPILKPEKIYEKKGYVNNVVFPSGALIKNDTLFVYYGGADLNCSVATCKVDKLIDELMKYKR